MKGGEGEHSYRLGNENYYYRRISAESFFLRKEIGNPLKSVSIDITGSRAIFGTGNTRGGKLWFRTRQGDIVPPSDLFGLFIPPNSIYTTVSDCEQTELAFVVTSDPALARASTVPRLFSTTIEDFDGCPGQCELLLEQMRSGSLEITGNEQTQAVSAVKAFIDSEYTDISSISELAEKFGLENWELSRQFKQGCGMSPLKYLNNLRTIEAVYRLLENGRESKIIDIAFNVGFRDLSRFNKQFKNFVRFIPRILSEKKN